MQIGVPYGYFWGVPILGELRVAGETRQLARSYPLNNGNRLVFMKAVGPYQSLVKETQREAEDMGLSRGVVVDTLGRRQWCQRFDHKSISGS